MPQITYKYVIIINNNLNLNRKQKTNSLEKNDNFVVKNKDYKKTNKNFCNGILLAHIIRSLIYVLKSNPAID